MGWTPDQVRQTRWSDFDAAWEGAMINRGVKPPMDDEEIDATLDLMKRHGWT